MVLLTGCTNSTNREDASQYPEMTVESNASSIQGLNQGVSSLPQMGFGGLSYFNSSSTKDVKIEKPSGVADVDSVVINGDRITLNTSSGVMVYRISFPNSYETISEDSYGWRFSVSRTDAAFADLVEICLYEEDKDGLPFFAFVSRDGQWSSWDIITWQQLPERKVMAKHPTDEEVAAFQEKRLGEDFVGL